MSVIANRKSSYFHTSSKRPRTDYSPSKDSSLNTDSYNSFLNELYVNLGMNPSDSKNDEKDLFRSMANTNESTTSLKLQKSHFEDIEKHFAYSVKSVDTPALQYGPDVPRSKDDSHASKSLSDGFPPVHTPGLSVFGTSFANDGAAKTVNNKLNESALDTSPEIDNKVNEPVSNVFVKSASSVHSRDLLKNEGREKEQDKNITDTSTLWVDGGLDNITLGAFDHTEKTSAPEPPMFSDIPSQTEETLMGPANTCIEFSNPVSQNTGNLREVPFDSALEDEQSANMTNRARNSPMFTMSVREESHIPSKPSWYITPHSHQNTAISGMSTNITDPLLDTALFATKSAGGMPVSSIYFYVDRETEPLAPKVGTGELVDEHLEVTASKFSKEDGEEIIEKKHIGSMDSMKSSTVDWKRKYTQQVEHNFAGCFEEIDEFVQEFDARTKDIVNNATAAAAAAAAAAVISANTTPAFSEDDISTFSSFKNDLSAGLRVKPTITSSSTDQSITTEKKFSTISDLKRSFSKDARKLKTQQSKEFGSIKPLQPVSESSSAKNETTKRSKSITSYDDAIEELSQEIGTLKSEENNRISSHSNKSNMEASSKSSLDNTDDSIHTTKTRKKASPSTDSTDKAVEITKSDNGSGKKLRGVFHAVTFKVRSKFGSDKKIVGPLVEKSLGSSRQGTRQKAVDALLFFVELDIPDPVIEDILPFLGHRIPKLVAGSVTTITEIIANFGTKKIAPALIVKILKTNVPKLFAHADKNVRAGAQQLVVELFRWMGDPVRELVMVQQDFLKPVQQKELESEFARVSAEPAPEQKRLLRSQQLELDQENADSDEDEEEAFGGTGGGLLDAGEPVEILSKIPDQFSARLSSTKWKDRKEVLEELLPVLTGAPRIRPDDYTEIMRLFAKSVVKDANIQVVMLAANCIESFAKGLRGDFTRYLPIVLSPLLERLKEKKAAVAEALRAALHMVYKVTASTTTLEDSFLDPILEAFKHKTPQVKIESAAFLVFILKLIKTTPKAVPEGKAIINASLKLLGDTQELVRIGGMEVLGVMMKLLGERTMGPYLDSVDDIKKGKIQEFYNTAEVKAKPPKANAPAGSAIKKKPAAAPESGLARKSSTASKSGEKTGLKKMLSPLKQALQSKQSLAKRSSFGTSASSEPPVTAAASPTSQKPVLRPRPTSMLLPSSSTPEQPVQPRQPISFQQTSSSPSQSPQPFQQPQSQQLQQQQFSYQAQPPVNTTSAEDQALIAQLRSENEALKAELQSTSSSRTKLLEDLHAIQNKVTGLLEAHTRDVLQIKSKETQLVRAQSDLEVVKLQLELEVEKRKNLMFTNSSSQSSIQSPPLPPVVVPRPQPPQQQQQQAIPQQQHYFNDDSVLDHPGHHSPLVSESELPKRARPMSYHPDSSPMGLGALGSGIPSFPGGFTGSGSSLDHSGGSPGSGSPNSRGSNWKRAAEVTVQLKARIEAMKARQNKALGEAI